ncbi:MAG TPA: hypothetical protein PKJ41_15360, partial [Bryobacteraceae bacterium]|nr:hypothetical protein [Bryobacteraceae bacterium]
MESGQRLSGPRIKHRPAFLVAPVTLEDRLNIVHGGNLFAIARSRGWDWREVLDLSASINPLGPSPLVRPAIEAELDRR